MISFVAHVKRSTQVTFLFDKILATCFFLFMAIIRTSLLKLYENRLSSLQNNGTEK